MLARKYDDYAWEEQTRETHKELRNRPSEKSYKFLRHKVMILMACFLAFYLVSVVRSEAYVSSSNSLVMLKQQESELISHNAELKIEVETLKSPARITGLAQANLGMQVARSNIYVQADSKKIVYDGYAYAK
ncbi:MAG: hypothetical protein EOL98_05750 [Negativicutes bacterium]|nr:hypothetical protein [Negativicutes bacterium]